MIFTRRDELYDPGNVFCPHPAPEANHDHPNGRTAHNRMTFRRFGFSVATLEETVRRVD